MLCESVTIPRFWNEFVLKRIPNAQIKFRKGHWIWRWLLKRKNIVYAIGRTVWFYSPGEFNKLAQIGNLESVLGHEFMHLRQKKYRELNWFGYGWPQIAVIFTLPLAVWLNSMALLLITICACVPWYSSRRINAEFSAYKMSLLMEMCKLRRTGCPTRVIRQWYQGYPERYTKTMFGRTYWCMFSPWFIKIGYQRAMESFLEHALQAMDQLAFVKKNSYIYTIGVDGIYREVFHYYLLPETTIN